LSQASWSRLEMKNSEGFRRHQGIAEGLSWRQIPQTSESTRKSLGRQLWRFVSEGAHADGRQS
jgi:hypothetical protein